jgi:hypothetical protein
MLIIPDLVLMQEPQHLCSNPSKSPENQSKVFSKENDHLQGFCNLQKSPAIYLTAFTRQRSLVRTQHRPLSKHLVLQVKRVYTASMPRIRRGVVQQPCSNVEALGQS